MRGARWRRTVVWAVTLAVLSLSDGLAQQADQTAAAAMVADAFGQLDRDRLDEAKALLDRALALAIENRWPRVEAAAHRGLGRMWAHKRMWEPAREALARALAICEALADDVCAGQVWNQDGTNAFYAQRHAEAADAYRRAADAFDRAGQPGEAANALRNLTFLTTVPLDQRVRTIADAARLAARAKQPALEGLVLHQWADLLVLTSDFAGAMAKLEAARRQLETAGNANQLARLYTSLGRLYRLHGDPSRALSYYRRALDRQLASHDRAGQAQTWNAMALAQYALGRTKDAETNFRRALDAAAGGPAEQLAFFQLQIAIFDVELGRAERGAAAIEAWIAAHPDSVEHPRALTVLAKGYAALRRPDDADAAVTRAIELLRDSADLEARRGAHFVRAAVRRDAGRPSDGLEDVTEGLRLIEAVRPSLATADSLRLGYGERIRPQIDLAVSLLHQLGRVEDAFMAAERGRSRALLDLLARQGVEDPSVGASVSIERLRAIRSRLQSTVISFWVTPRVTYVWVLTREGTIHSRTIAVQAAELERLVRGMSTAAASHLGGAPGAPESRVPPWRGAYDSLVRPLRQWLPVGDGARLTIVPDGVLSRIPFAALQNERGRYLVEGYEIHYAPSLALIEHREGSAPATDRALVVADPAVTPSPGVTLGRLPGARREALSIAGHRAALTLAGRDATERAIRNRSAQASLLHFAVHAIADDERPMQSFLALAGRSTDSMDDGRLTAREIHELQLSARLVVLSACRSGGGRVTGDGIVGLTRAFLAAGADAVMTSVWDMPDETAPLLFDRFYNSARAGGPAAALRAAQLAMLADLRAGTFEVETAAGKIRISEHPAIWAGLQLWGGR